MPVQLGVVIDGEPKLIDIDRVQSLIDVNERLAAALRELSFEAISDPHETFYIIAATVPRKHPSYRRLIRTIPRRVTAARAALRLHEESKR